MQVHPNSFAVRPEICVSEKCENNCDGICEFCINCLSQNEKFDMLQAYREQMNGGSFKRIFPPSKEFLEKAGDDFWKNLETKSRKHVEWFDEMCKKNRKFC